MNGKSKHNKNPPSPNTLERLMFKPVQELTQFIIGLNKADDNRVGNGISLGDSSNIYNQKKVEEVILSPDAISKHTYILGHSGSGKTYLILLILMSYIKRGLGFGLIDIHGDLTRMLLSFIASTVKTQADLERVKRHLVLIEPFDKYYAPSFNPLSVGTNQNAYTTAHDMFHTFKEVWKDVAWGARMDETLRNVLLTLALTKRPLTEAPIFLTNDNYRAFIVDKLNDYDLKFYWENRFNALSDRMKPQYVEPILNKLTIFTSDPLIRHIIAQKDSSINFRDMMDSKKWIIINISKGALSQNSYLLGSQFSSAFKNAALSRSNIHESQRVPFCLAVDEFQNFMGHNFEEILSEARKYKLSLILAHQNLAQIDKEMRESIFGNVENSLFFKLGHSDIKEISNKFREIDQKLLKQILSTLKVGETVKREPDGSFRKIKVHNISPPRPNNKIIEQLRQSCKTKYYKKRTDIDRELSQLRESYSTQPTIEQTPEMLSSMTRNNSSRYQEGEL